MRSATTGKNYVRWRGEGGGNCKMRPALHSSKTMGFYPVGKSGLSDLIYLPTHSGDRETVLLIICQVWCRRQVSPPSSSVKRAYAIFKDCGSGVNSYFDPSFPIDARILQVPSFCIAVAPLNTKTP